MNKYQIFNSLTSEEAFWNQVFAVLFDDFQTYEVAEKYDDDFYGVDVWVNGGMRLRVGVQLKTSRNLNVNIHYEMECVSGWKKPLGINVYVNSPKLDYLVYAYPDLQVGFLLSKKDLKIFWDRYHNELVDYNLKEYPENYSNECWKYYFQISTKEFAKRCDKLGLDFQRFKLSQK